MYLNRGAFASSDLVKVPAPGRPVVLNSGGPVMDVEWVEGGTALCRWKDGDGKIARAVIPTACLMECRPMGES